MAYTETKLTNLGHLKDIAERFAAENSKNVNVLESVKVNGVALAIAQKAVDILIATGGANGTLAVNGTDVAIKGLAALAYKAQVSQTDLDTALQTVVTNIGTLVGSDAGKSARTIANEELAAQLIPDDAKDSLNTLQEIANWIQDHPDDASAMNTAITKLQAIAAGIGGEEDDYATVVAAIEGKLSAAQSAIYAAITAGDTNGHLKVNGTDVTVYTHPAHTAKQSGLYKVAVDAEGHVTDATPVAKSDITNLGIPAQDTTYSDVTAGGASGLMSGADKHKLDGMVIATDDDAQRGFPHRLIEPKRTGGRVGWEACPEKWR